MKLNTGWYVTSLVIMILIYSALYFYVDVPFAFATRLFTDNSLYHAAKYITYLGTGGLWLIIAVATLVLAAIKLDKKQKMSEHFFKWFYVCLSVVFASIIGSILKVCLARYRPEMLFEHGLYGFHFFSFQDVLHSTPSGHSLTIFAVCTAMSIAYRRYALLFMLVALAVSVTRVILDKHYVSDVVFGAYIGAFASCVVYQFINQWKPSICVE